MKAYAELMFYPTRVVIKDKQRSATVEMINREPGPATYRITIVNRRMTEAGEIIDADTPQVGELFSKDMLFYAPRQVTLPAGASQILRFSVRRPPGLATGEYRSHILFRRVADAVGSSNLKNAASQSGPGQLRIVMQALVGASIPVIVRQGVTRATVTLDALSIEPATGTLPSMLDFRFNRTGNGSTYGDLTAVYSAPGKKPIEIGRVDGIAVYAPNLVRTARLALALPVGASIHGGILTLSYAENTAAGGARLAESKIAVP